MAGCLSDEDCKDGHYCDITMDQPTCFEIDECDIDNVFFNGSAYCGAETTCTNTVGSFTCTCLTGFISHTAWVGCRSALPLWIMHAQYFALIKLNLYLPAWLAD